MNDTTDERVVRVMVQYTPQLYGFLGLAKASECLPHIRLRDVGYARVRSTPRWVLYQQALDGYGEGQFHPAQR